MRVNIMRAAVIASLTMCISVLAAWVSWADEVKPSSELVQTAIERLKKMTLDEQQAWLGGLEERAKKAGRTTLSAEAAAEFEAKIHDMLHRKKITWKVLGEAIELTDEREKAALAMLQKADDKPDEPQPKTKPEETSTVAAAKEEQAPAKDEKPPRIADRAPRESRVPPPSRVVPPKENEEPSSGGDVEINFEELAARIAGFNLALKALQADLDEKGRWNAARLESPAKRLQVLILRRGDLELFRGLAPEELQETLGKLDCPKAAIAQLGSRIFEARRAAESSDYSGSPEERELELKRLDAVSRRLADVVKGEEAEEEEKEKK